MHKQRAFTLLELIIVLVIAGTLMAIGMPSFLNMIKDNRRATEINSFVTALTLARSEAIKRSATISVCQSSTGTSCTNSGQWEDGWIVFINTNSDVPPVVDAGEEVLRVRAALGSGTTVRGTGDFSNSISYSSNGFPANVTTGGLFRFCDSRGATHARAAIISSTGRSKLSQDSDSDGIHEDAANGNLTCP